ncbi:MAG: hypothetical protein GX444_17930 [Myxococcales bacterium]|nr:hypothetical protein [Myxococcales bacterium]
MKKTLLFLFLATVLGLSLMAMTCGDDDDDNDDVSETCDLDVLTQETADLCGGDVTYTGQAESDDACAASCDSGQVPYWYSDYGACHNECFCCGTAA